MTNLYLPAGTEFLLMVIVLGAATLPRILGRASARPDLFRLFLREPGCRIPSWIDVMCHTRHVITADIGVTIGRRMRIGLRHPDHACRQRE